MSIEAIIGLAVPADDIVHATSRSWGGVVPRNSPTDLEAACGVGVTPPSDDPPFDRSSSGACPACVEKLARWDANNRFYDGIEAERAYLRSIGGRYM